MESHVKRLPIFGRYQNLPASNVVRLDIPPLLTTTQSARSLVLTNTWVEATGRRGIIAKATSENFNTDEQHSEPS